MQHGIFSEIIESINFIFFPRSTCFLMGPLKQLRNMFKEKRLIATIMMLVRIQLFHYFKRCLSTLNFGMSDSKAVIFNLVRYCCYL